MPSFDSLPLAAIAAAAAVVLCLLLALLAWRLRQRRSAASRLRPRARAERPSSREGSDLVARYHPSAVRVLTACEREAFDLVRGALPEHLVMAQVPLVRYLRVQEKRTEDDWLRGLSMLSADILVCDTSSRPVIAVEILPPKPGPKAHERHERMRQLLEGVGVRVLIWPEGRLPTAEQAQAQLRTALESEGTPRPGPRGTRDGVAAGARRRAAGSDLRSDSRIEPELGAMDPPAPETRPGQETRQRPATSQAGRPASASPKAPASGAAAAARDRAPGAPNGTPKAAPAGTPNGSSNGAPNGASNGTGAARPAAASGFAPLIPVPEIAELLAEGDEIAARHSSFDPVSLTFFDEFEARQQGPASGAH